MNDTTSERWENVYQEYLRVINTHGKYARLMAKIDIYREVGDRMGYNPDYVARIIRHKLKTRQ